MASFETDGVHVLVVFYQWRLQNEGVRTNFYFSSRRVKLFLFYLARGAYYHQFGRSEGLSLTASYTSICIFGTNIIVCSAALQFSRQKKQLIELIEFTLS